MNKEERLLTSGDDLASAVSTALVLVGREGDSESRVRNRLAASAIAASRVVESGLERHRQRSNVARERQERWLTLSIEGLSADGSERSSHGGEGEECLGEHGKLRGWLRSVQVGLRKLLLG